MLAELRHGELARRFGHEMPRTLRAGQGLLTNLALQGHEGMKQRLGPRRAARDVRVHGEVAVNAFEHVVTLL